MNLTQKEYNQLKAIKADLWIARDKDGGLYCYLDKPIKDITFVSDKWFSVTGECIEVDDEFLPSLTWESEPLNIDEALKNNPKTIILNGELTDDIKTLFKDKRGLAITEDKCVGKWINLHDTDEWYGDLYKCPSCNDVNIGISNYCPNCGRRLEKST